MARSREALFRAVSDAVLGIASERTVDGSLRALAAAARELAGARYAALGVPDGEGGFRSFITVGMSAKTMAAIGPLPRTHGMLGAMLESAEPHRSSDITSEPRFEGYPSKHPVMRSFLGVPIVRGGVVLGSFYLTGKRPRGDFTEDDQEAIELLAAHAAVALENADLLERSRELSVVEERNRLARELHDAVSQTLFSATLTAEAAAELVPADPEAAQREIRRAGELLQEASTELRALIFQLRPAELERAGLTETLRKHVEVVTRVHQAPVEFRAGPEGRQRAAVEQGAYRIAQEALANAVRHSGAGRIEVELACDGNGGLRLAVIDDGAGFDPDDPALASSHLGLTSMRERAEELGGELRISSRQGSGTSIVLEVRDGARAGG
jgi:signal transduction histidine kinase